MENMPSLPGRFESASMPLAASQTAYTVAHGRGTPPRFAWWTLVCVIADNGHQPGCELLAGGYDGLPTVKWDAAQIQILVATDFHSNRYMNSTGGAVFAPTLSHWQLKCYADF